jgi:hypothetical protein
MLEVPLTPFTHVPLHLHRATKSVRRISIDESSDVAKHIPVNVRQAREEPPTPSDAQKGGLCN